MKHLHAKYLQARWRWPVCLLALFSCSTAIGAGVHADAPATAPAVTAPAAAPAPATATDPRALTAQAAVEKIRALIGVDLRPLADRYGVTVWKDGRLNKGWAGQVLERYLGLPLNNWREADFRTWDLKLISLKRRRDGTLQVKETMAITMINPTDLLNNEFETSHLLNKMRRLVVVGRIFESAGEESSCLHAVAQFDLTNPVIYARVKADYNLIRRTARTAGFDSLNGRIGVLLQPRTKGAGNGSTSRDFYARTAFVAHMLGLGPLPKL